MRLVYSQCHYNYYYYYTKPPSPPNHHHHHHHLLHNTIKTSYYLRGVRMASSSPTHSLLQLNNTIINDKEKLLVIMGATGCGKSNLSVDLATHFSSSSSCSFEIINSDKMQVYKGLDITTNKIPLPDRKGIPHHLLGYFDPAHQPQPELSPSSYRLSASSTISDIVSRGNLPVLVGGSNSFIHALLVDDFKPGLDFFSGPDMGHSPTRLRYDCCILWVDVSFRVLSYYLCKRVDEMLECGMLEELEGFFGDLQGRSGFGKMERGVGLMKAIGVPEFEGYFRKYPPGPERSEAYQEAVMEIKRNTCQLAMRQIEKIQKLRDVALWDLHRIDATSALEWKLAERESSSSSSSSSRGGKTKKRWEKEVVEPSVEIVRRFLETRYYS